jgi:hypothetical protein
MNWTGFSQSGSGSCGNIDKFFKEDDNPPFPFEPLLRRGFLFSRILSFLDFFQKLFNKSRKRNLKKKGIRG